MGKLTLLCGTLLLWATATEAAHAQAGIDLSGVWQIADTTKQLKTAEGTAPPFRPEAAKAYAANTARLMAGDLSFDPTARCIAPGLPRILTLPYPFQIIQRADKMLFMFQWNYWNRRVDLTGKKQDVPYPLSLGVSGGHFEGDQLVINTVGLRSDNTWLDSAGMPHSEDMVVEERITLLDGGQTMQDRVTITDPKTFTRPWTTVLRFKRQPAGTRIREDVCLDRIDAKQPAVDWSK